MTIDEREPSVKHQIRNMLLVITSGVMGAILLSLFFLYSYGPSGRYQASHALLSPQLANTLAFNDTNHKTGGSSRFIFDGIEFTYFEKNGQKNLIQIDLPTYEKFYQMISADQSLLDISNDVLGLFNQGTNSSLVIKIRTDSHAQWQDETKIFQEVAFASEGNYYRIELREDKAGEWAYYYHPGIYQATVQTFIP